MNTYALVCCDGEPIAYVTPRTDNDVAVKAARHTDHLKLAYPVFNDDGTPVITTEEQFQSTMQESVTERLVTEVQWLSGRSWVIRCPDCPRQVEVKGETLRALIDQIDPSALAEVDDNSYLLPLGVVSLRLSRPNLM